MSTQAEPQAAIPADTVSGSGPVSDGTGNITGGNTGPGASSGWMVLLFFIIGLAGSLLVGWIAFPHLLYEKKEQPVRFSHVIHMDQVDDGCNSCHYFRDDGTFAGVPDLASCEDCHSDEAMGEDPAEQLFIDDYLSKEKEIPWLIYSRQPPCVFFSHAAHVKGADMSCESCHGDYANSKTLKTYEQNRISGYSRDIWGYSISGLGSGAPDGPRPMKMNDCAACHLKETGSKGACFQCHK